MTDIIKHSDEVKVEEHDNEFDPWTEWGLGCVGYNGQIDTDVINILKRIREKKFCTDIAKELNLPAQYVELIQSILASHDIVEYGTSPRGCWFNMSEIEADAYIKKWEDFYFRQYNENYDA